MAEAGKFTDTSYIQALAYPFPSKGHKKLSYHQETRATLCISWNFLLLY